MKTFTLLALSGLALATPHGNRHSKLFGSGGGYIPKPTGGFYPGGPGNGTFPGANSTGAGSSGVGSIPVLTKTSLSLVDSANPTGLPDGGFDKPDTSENIIDDDNVAAGGNGNGECAAAVTETETSIQYVTVTAGSETKPSGLPQGDSEDSNVSLTDVVKPSAGEFYGRPTGGFGGNNGGYGAPSQGAEGAPAVPTSFAPQPTGDSSFPTGGAGGDLPAPSSPPVSGGSGSGSGNNTGTVPSGGKRGLSYNKANLLSPFEGTGMSWAYNWASQPDGTLPSGVEYVPMCWGLKSVPQCAQDAAGSPYVLGFNEPDHHEQANLDFTTAAQKHIEIMNPLAEAGSQVSTPAITNGGDGMGISYLQDWFNACDGMGGCAADFVAFHWYDSADHIEYFKQHVQDVADLAAQNGINRLWLTEFGVTSGDEASFIKEATAFLDSFPGLERYAYFMASDGILLSGGSLSGAGQAYVGQA